MHTDRIRNRFFSHVQKTDACWLWTASRNREGYGKATVKHKDIRAHRLSWEIHFGPIPDGMLVLHHCDNPPCVNPEHLWLGTTLDNARDRCKKGRGATGLKHGWHTKPESIRRGEDSPNAKLTAALVSEIKRRLAAGEPVRPLGRELGIPRTTVRKIQLGITWKHIK